MKTITRLVLALPAVLLTLAACRKEPELADKRQEKTENCPRILALKTPDQTVYKVSTFAGTNVQGYADGPLCESRFNALGSIAIAGDGTVYLTDNGFFDQHVTIRKITPGGIVSTLAGGNSGYADGKGEAAQFTALSGIAVGKDGNLYVGDRFRIRKITPEGEVSTFAGDGNMGYLDGPAAQAQFTGISAIAISDDGNLYVPDQQHHVIRKISPDGTVSWFAGKDTVRSTSDGGYRDGPREQASFSYPQTIKVMADGSMFISELSNQRFRKISADGIVSTWAEAESKTGVGSGFVINPDGSMFVSQGKRIRKILTDGSILEIAGENYENPFGSNTPTYRDGIGLKARFFEVTDLALYNRCLYIVDPDNFCVRRMNVD